MAKAKDSIVAGKVPTRTQSAELTPMMVQYLTIKDQHQNEVLFFRLGDFYEMFDKDALEVSRLLNLTLTHRAGQPMCGIPYHAAKIYIARLLRCGKRIAICEQVTEPTGKGLTERKVIEVITPGTAVESEYLDGGSNNFLACVCSQKGRVGFAYIDVTTSDFYATSWYEDDMGENFSKEIGRCHPRELLLSQSLEKNEIIQNILLQNEDIALSYYPDWNFDLNLSYKRLLNQFKTASLQSFSLDEKSPEVAPAGFLLDYLQKTATTDAPHITGIKVYRDSQFVVMDDSSRRNLEIVENLRDGTSQFSLLECLSYTQTAMGKRLLRNWLLYPLTDCNEIISRQNHVEFFVKNRNILESVRESFADILDIERLAGRIAMERAHAKDLQALRASLENWIKIRSQIENQNFTRLDEKLAQEIVALINASILDDPATSITEGRIIREGWSPELDQYRKLHDNVSQILADYAEEEKTKTGIQNLRIRSNNLTGYYIEITRGKADHVPSHFILRRSLTNADRYTTERLQELEKQIREAELNITETEKNLFLEIRSKIAEHTSYLLQTAKEVAYADLTSALAHAAILQGWVRPLVDNSRDFEIRGGRHPVVEMHLPGGEFVPNDLCISGGQESSQPYFCLITGPNMAGKSTYLRQNALIALLAQTGSFVPASQAHIGIVDRIFCRVGASDNLARGESTFLVEMTETAYILRTATEKSLVIMDEVGRGTSTEDGLSIAWAVSEYLLNALKCKTLFATHYHELTRLNHPFLKLLCMEVSEENDKVTFLRRIKEGASENSYGIHVASLAGLPQSVIRRANEILNSLHSSEVNGENSSSLNVESISTRQTDSSAKTLEKSLSMPGLFSDEEMVLDEILSAEVDDMTPRQALDLIARWKKSLGGR